MITSLPTRLDRTVGRARLRIKGDNSKRDLPYRTAMGAQTRTRTVEEHGLGLGQGATDVGHSDGTGTFGRELGKSELAGYGLFCCEAACFDYTESIAYRLWLCQ